MFDVWSKRTTEILSELNHPEAITAVANMFYQKIMQCYGFDIACQIPIPIDCHSSLHARYLIKMWSLLDKAVELEWISPFLLLQPTLALENNSWKISHSIKRELIKRRIEALEELKELREKHSNGCYNSNCLLKLEGDSSLIKSTKCLLAKYCSVNCQVNDWQRDTKECVQATSTDRDVDTGNNSSQHIREECNNVLANKEAKTSKIADINVYGQKFTICKRTIKPDLLKQMQDGSFLENENKFFEDDSINETKTRLLSMPNNSTVRVCNKMFNTGH